MMGTVIDFEKRRLEKKLLSSFAGFKKRHQEKRRTKRPLAYLELYVSAAIEQFYKGTVSSARIEKLCNDLDIMTPADLFIYVEAGRDPQGYFTSLRDQVRYLD
jgi:hypothetical protein